MLFTDLLARAGIATPALADQTRRRIRQALPDVTPHNPMEMGGLFLSGDGATLEDALSALSDDPNIDALVLCVPPYLEARDRFINGAIVRATEALAKPMVVVSYGVPGAASVLKDAGRFILEPPEPGVMGLKSWLDYRPLVQDAASERRASGDAGAVLGELAARGKAMVLEDAGKALLQRYGVECPAEQVVADCEQALAAAERLGYPVALKILAPDMPHRGVGKGVLLGLADRESVARGFASLSETATGLRDARILVQAMVKPGMEFLIGAVRDPELGLTLAIGMGGVNVEATREVVFCVPPISRGALRHMLAGWGALARAQARHGAVDIEALISQITRIAALVEDASDVIEELDVNPVIVGRPGEGAVAVDALFILKARETGSLPCVA